MSIVSDEVVSGVAVIGSFHVKSTRNLGSSLGFW